MLDASVTAENFSRAIGPILFIVFIDARIQVPIGRRTEHLNENFTFPMSASAGTVVSCPR